MLDRLCMGDSRFLLVYTVLFSALHYVEIRADVLITEEASEYF